MASGARGAGDGRGVRLPQRQMGDGSSRQRSLLPRRSWPAALDRRLIALIQTGAVVFGAGVLVLASGPVSLGAATAWHWGLAVLLWAVGGALALAGLAGREGRSALIYQEGRSGSPWLCQESLFAVRLWRRQLPSPGAGGWLHESLNLPIAGGVSLEVVTARAPGGGRRVILFGYSKEVLSAACRWAEALESQHESDGS